MAKTNYNKMSNKSKIENNSVIETSSLELEQTTVEVEAPMEESRPEPKKGVVVGCSKLNIRKEPNVNAEIRGTLDAGTTVVIHDEIGEFYKIGNPDLGEYCMKKYISVK